MNSVLWMNAALGALASDRPVKKRRNGRLPPTIAINVSVPKSRRASRGNVRRRATNTGTVTATRASAAAPFLSVVNTPGSDSSLTA